MGVSSKPVAAHPIKAVDCAGNPRTVGRAHGEALRPVVADGLERWLTYLGETHLTSPDNYLGDFLASTDYLPAIERWTPTLLEEVRGIAEGADRPFHQILAYSLMDEEWAFAKARHAQAPGCTVACFRGSGDTAPVLAQTMDIPSLHDGTQVVLRIRPPDGPEALVFAYAGMIALNGCNAAGVGVVVNALEVLPSSIRGLPVAFVLRGVLARTSLAGAVEFVRSVPHASGQHYALGGPDGLASLECSANGAVEDAAVNGRVLHTNHPLVCTDLACDPEQSFARSRTRERHAYLLERAPACAACDDVERLLADTSVPVSLAPGRGYMTFGAVSMKLTVPPRLRVAPGPPHGTPFVEVEFSGASQSTVAYNGLHDSA